VCPCVCCTCADCELARGACEHFINRKQEEVCLLRTTHQHRQKRCGANFIFSLNTQSRDGCRCTRSSCVNRVGSCSLQFARGLSTRPVVWQTVHGSDQLKAITAEEHFGGVIGGVMIATWRGRRDEKSRGTEAPSFDQLIRGGSQSILDCGVGTGGKPCLGLIAFPPTTTSHSIGSHSDEKRGVTHATAGVAHLINGHAC